jgi:general secretion pathway protein B
MSFILDALKKSESERQRKGTPGIADVPQAAPRSGGARWAWIIGVLLTVNLAVLGGLMLRSKPVQAPLSDLSTPQLPAAIAPAPTIEKFSEIVAEVKGRQPDSPVESGAALHDEAPLVPANAGQVANAIGSRASVVDGLATFNELQANGSLQLPDLHLDIHVYSTTPSERFVFINMSRYKENATLTEGPGIQEITPDGVILEYLGTRFLLPRE